MPKDFIDDDLMRDPRTPRLSLGLDNSRRDGFIPSSKDPPSRPIADLELTSLAGSRAPTPPPPGTIRPAAPAASEADLAALESRQAEIEEERQLLEELYRKQKTFESDREELRASIAKTRALVDSASAELDSRRTALDEARATLDSASASIDAIREDDWEGTKILDELDSAIATFATLRADCGKAAARISAARPSHRAFNLVPPAATGFAANALRGLAFFLPLMVFLVLFALWFARYA